MKKMKWSSLKEELSDYPFTHHMDQFIKRVSKEENVLKIYLFGSIIDNSYTYNSDVDILLKLKVSRGFYIEQQHFKKLSTFKDLLDVFPYSVEEFNAHITNPHHFLQKLQDDLVIVIL